MILEFFLQYGLFLAKAVTIVIAIALLIIFIVSLSHKSREKDRIEIKKLNDKYDALRHALQEEMLPKNEFKKINKLDKKKTKQAKKKSTANENKKRIFVLNFDGDIKASAVSSLREEITAILTLAKPDDEVFLKLESGGGLVHSYGLASSQLMRIRNKDIPLTVSVDKVAASGGYMMACVASKIISAPFAILGSIGVLAQIPNFHRLLQKNDIDFEQFTAGEFKRTVTMFGENTDNARNKFKEDIEDTHTLFKNFVTENRPAVDIDRVSTGEHWFGTRAKELNLVDDLMTSDDFLLEHSNKADLYEISFTCKKPLGDKLSSLVQQTVNKLFLSWWQQSEQSKYQ